MDKYTYRVTWSEEDQEYVGLCAELPSLSWLDESYEEAFKGIRKLAAETIADMHNNAEKIPEPLSTKKYSGNLSLRMTSDLHRALALRSAEEGVSISRIINNTLAVTL